MKHVFTNEKAVEAWFDRVTKCDAKDPQLDVYSAKKRIMAEGHTLYSYGRHFAMAMWYPEEQVFLLNTTSRRSSSTNKHQSYVRRNAPQRSIEVGAQIDLDPRISAHMFLQRWDHLIRHDLEKSKRARKHYAFWLGQAGKSIRNRNLFTKTFNIKAPELPEDVTAALVTLKLAA